MLRLTFFTLLIASGFDVFGQVGGQRSFEFINVPSSPRVSGLGGVNVSLANEDVAMAYANPAANGDTISGQVSFNYMSYIADVHSVSTFYQREIGNTGSWFIGANHFNYGNFDSYDATGGFLGEFDAAETVVMIGKSHQIRAFVLGAAMKFLNSNIATYQTSALAMDIGGMFKHPKTGLTIGLVFKNMGLVLSEYTDSDQAKLPFDLQTGVSFKPKHMPLRFSITVYNLYKGDIVYFNTNDVNFNRKEPNTFDKIFRHIVIGTEILITKNVNLRLGYNQLVHQELKLEERSGGAGFSYGLMFRIKTFEFAYSRGGYHVAGGSNSFSVTTNTNLLFKKKKS